MEVVWAKFSPKEPWWPGLIFLPTLVTGSAQTKALKTCSSKYLIYFFGSGKVILRCNLHHAAALKSFPCDKIT